MSFKTNDTANLSYLFVISSLFVIGITAWHARGRRFDPDWLHQFQWFEAVQINFCIIDVILYHSDFFLKRLAVGSTFSGLRR